MTFALEFQALEVTPLAAPKAGHLLPSFLCLCSCNAALPGRNLPSFHDTDVEILLLLYFRVLTIALIALFAVVAMRENRGQLFLWDLGWR